MNVKTVLIVAVVCGAASLGGCASMGGKDGSALTSSLSDEVDTAYIAQINHQANEHFMTEIWVNPPQKPQHN